MDIPTHGQASRHLASMPLLKNRMRGLDDSSSSCEPAGDVAARGKHLARTPLLKNRMRGLDDSSSSCEPAGNVAAPGGPAQHRLKGARLRGLLAWIKRFAVRLRTGEASPLQL